MLLEFVCKLNMQMQINRKQMLKFQRLNKYDNKNNKLAHHLQSINNIDSLTILKNKVL